MRKGNTLRKVLELEANRTDSKSFLDRIHTISLSMKHHVMVIALPLQVVKSGWSSRRHKGAHNESIGPYNGTKEGQSNFVSKVKGIVNRQ